VRSVITGLGVSVVGATSLACLDRSLQNLVALECTHAELALGLVRQLSLQVTVSNKP
jgi:hypothetical protein